MSHCKESRTLSNQNPARSKQDRASRADQMRRERDKADRRQRNVITVVIVVVIAALIGTAAWAISKETNKPAAKFVAPASVTSDFGITWDLQASKGKPTPDDAVKMVIYEDFQCPGCQAFEAANGSFLQQEVDKGEIAIEYRPVSFFDGASTNEYSSRAMNAALCVLDTEGVKTYQDMHNLLFANQTPEGGAGHEDSVLISLAEQAGAKKVDGCIENQKFVPWVRKASEQAKTDGISGTPTVLIDGKKVEGAKANTLPAVADLQKAIKAAKKG